jgi:hypothetical protein
VCAFNARATPPDDEWDWVFRDVASQLDPHKPSVVRISGARSAQLHDSVVALALW